MDFSSLQNLSDSDKETLRKLSATIRKERASARAQKCRLENIILSYQTRIAAFTKERQLALAAKSADDNGNALIESKIAAARKEVQEQSDAHISKLREELSTAHKKLQESMAETMTYQRKESEDRKKAADDAQTISQLREEVEQLRDSKEKIANDAAQQQAQNMELLRESHLSSSKVTTYEETNNFLKGEVVRLSRELAETRTLMDENRAVDQVAVESATRANTDLTDQLAKANVTVEKLTSEVSGLERKLIDVQADFDREKADQQAEVENLNKLVEMHKEATKDAEIRLAGYSEVLGTLAKEKKDMEQLRPTEGNSVLERHAQVLFKDLNEALDAKLMVLEKEREELTKARAAEARMATKNQALIREADTAREELYNARQQLATLEAELSAQKNRASELERKILTTESSAAAPSPSGFPFRTSRDSGLPSEADMAGWGSGMQPYTPSPFRRTVRLGSAEKALARMAEIRRTHEALLEGLRDRREDHMELTNS